MIYTPCVGRFISDYCLFLVGNLQLHLFAVSKLYMAEFGTA